MKFYLKCVVMLASVVFSLNALAEEAPKVGRGAAAKYFKPRNPDDQESSPAAQNSQNFAAEDHYLAIHFGAYTSSQAYEWGGHGKEESVGGNNVGLTYRVGEWHKSMDLNIRVEFNEYKVADLKPTKLSFLPLITFPDATSRFPLYFGAGAGLGVFLNQVPEESAISLDYQLVAGARFFNVFENTGFFLESGLKNHLLLLSSGQLNGVFISAGAVFTF